MEGPRSRPSASPGLVVGAAAISGVSGLICGFIAAARVDFVGAGACFLAAAVAFGLLANALFRQ